MKRSGFARKTYVAQPSGRQWEGGAITPRAVPTPLAAPARTSAPVEKTVYVRSPALLAAVKTLPCMNCCAPAPSDPAHSNSAIHGKGRTIKASDIYIAALCRECHGDLDQGARMTLEQRRSMWWSAHVKTVRTLVQRGLWPAGIVLPQLEACPW